MARVRRYIQETGMEHGAMIVVRCEYDEDARVWYVKSSDLPGLSGEAPTFDALADRIPGMILDLIEENGIDDRAPEIPIEIIACRHERVRMRLRQHAPIAQGLNDRLR